MKTIKVMDLLNKIANNEEIPKIIKYHGYKWEYSFIENNYIRKCEIVAYRLTLGLNELNDEVEIIEEEKKLPEKCRHAVFTYSSLKDINYLEGYVNDLIDTINEILDYLESKGNK